MQATTRWLLIVIGSVAGAASSALASSYWDFNVFSGSTIGKADQGYGSSFVGASGAVGNAWFSSMGLRTDAAASPSLPMGFYGGGDFTLSGGVHHGGVFAAGDVTLNNASIAGGLDAGGNLAGAGGSITGDARLGGKKLAGNAVSVSGALSTKQTVDAPVDLKAAKSYFLALSESVREKAPTTMYSNQWGNLVIKASEPVSYVDISKSDFQGAWGVSISGSGTVVVNVIGDGFSFGSKTWTYSDGASAGTTLLNFADATSITMSGSQTVNLLAPKAAMSFSGGTITGNLIVGSLVGSGSAAWNGGFQASETISEAKQRKVRVVRWREVPIGE